MGLLWSPTTGGSHVLAPARSLPELGPSLTHRDGKGMRGGLLFSKILKGAPLLRLTQHKARSR